MGVEISLNLSRNLKIGVYLVSGVLHLRAPSAGRFHMLSSLWDEFASSTPRAEVRRMCRNAETSLMYHPGQGQKQLLAGIDRRESKNPGYESKQFAMEAPCPAWFDSFF